MLKTVVDEEGVDVFDVLVCHNVAITDASLSFTQALIAELLASTKLPSCHLGNVPKQTATGPERPKRGPSGATAKQVNRVPSTSC
jgi:hypothetical protein